MIRGLFAFIIAVLSAGVVAAQVGTPIPSGQTVTIDQHGECRKVTNPGSGTRMVFTGTAAEWTSFRDNPNEVTMAACSSPCGGTSVGGYCWYRGATNQSCTTVCGSRGGVNMAGTRNYAGSGGTNAGCTAVGNAFGIGGSATAYSASGTQGWGCGTAIFDNLHRYTRTTAAGALQQYIRRFCACNN